MCAECKEEVPATIRVEGLKRRLNNAIVDHIEPVVDPQEGFQGYSIYVERLFCEKANLQVLCHACHVKKCNEERAVAAERRLNE